MVKFFVGKKWRIFRQVTKIISDEKLMPTKIITDKVITDKVWETRKIFLILLSAPCDNNYLSKIIYYLFCF